MFKGKKQQQQRKLLFFMSSEQIKGEVDNDDKKLPKIQNFDYELKSYDDIGSEDHVETMPISPALTPTEKQDRNGSLHVLFPACVTKKSEKNVFNEDIRTLTRDCNPNLSQKRLVLNQISNSTLFLDSN